MVEAVGDGRVDRVLCQILQDSLLTRDDVLPGVPEMLNVLYIDALFPDGTRLVTVRNPIR